MKSFSVLAITLLAMWLASTPAMSVAATAPNGLKASYQPSKLTENVYVIHGPVSFPTPQNQGFRNNPGIVITSKGVVIIDPGSSVHIGSMVVGQVRKLTNKPVVAVFNTHVHGDHWLGNDGIKRAFPKAVIYSHPKMKSLIADGAGEDWIKILNDRTNSAISGTRPVGPDKTVTQGDIIKIGDTRFRILHSGPAHTDNDIMIHVMEQGVLFTGDIVRNGLIGRVQKSTAGSIEALDLALKTNAQIFVPGHGKTGTRQIVDRYRVLMVSLLDTIRKNYDEGLESHQIKPILTKLLDPYKNWVGFKTNLGYLTSTIYLEVEGEAFKE